MNELLSLIEDQNIIAWMMNHNIKTERGYTFDFDTFSFMIDPYLDWTPEQAARKCSQVGWSVKVNLQLFYASQYGIPGYEVEAANVIYTLPSDKDVSDFVPSKTDLLIANNPILQSYIKGESSDNVNAITRKKLGNSMVYFKGTKSKTAALMITSDLNIHDEADRSEPVIVDQYESRVGTSKYKGIWKFSNPSYPNAPSDKAYLKSDQKHWFICCERCGHWQYLDWYKLSEFELKKDNHCFVDDVNGFFVCSNCTFPISDENRKRGRWVKKYQDKSISGYWVSHFMCSWMSCKKILETEKDKSKAYFMNFVAGKPYAGSDVIIDESLIVKNIVLDDHKWVPGRVAMGIDSGDVKHFVIGDEQGIFHIGKTRSWADIDLLIRKYQPYFVVDLNPYPRQAKELVQTYRHGWCSFYVDDRRTLELMEWGDGDKMRMVYPNRERIIDELINYIVDGGIKFFRSKEYWIEYIAHWLTMYQADMIGDKVIASDTDGVTSGEQGLKLLRKVWLSSGEDHFPHATVYFYCALSRMIAGGGKILRSHADALKAIQQNFGSVKTAPIVEDNRMQPTKTFIPKNIGKPARKKTSVSGNM